MKKLAPLLGLLVLLSLDAAAQTPRITFTVPMLYPEGTAYNPKNGSFYVSSVKTGTIGLVDAKGNYTVFFQDPALKSSFGMKVDAAENRLWVCLSDPKKEFSLYTTPATLEKMGRVIVLDLASSKKVLDVDLSSLYPGKHFINDVALDAQGTAYLTDSFSPVIYKVDKSGKASVAASDPQFKSIDIGLNGIVVHPAGYLITVNNSNGSILKVDLNDPKNVSRVKIDQLFPGADGLLLDGQNNLVLVQNKSVDKVYTLASSDNWVTAKITSATGGTDRFQQPSTALMKDGKVWVLNSKLNEIGNPTIPPSKEFSLQLAEFKPVD